MYNLANKFDKNSVGLYRIEGLAIFKNINGHRADKIRKEFHQLFEENGLSLEIEFNLKTINYLDITLDLSTSTYKPYRKPNDEKLYIRAKSNHSANILKQLSISIETRLSGASKHCQNILSQYGYEYELQYEPPNNKSKNKSKSSKNRRKKHHLVHSAFFKEHQQHR